jgi:hypothetical protein
LDGPPKAEKYRAINTNPISKSKTKTQNASISVIVPLYFPNPGDIDRIRNQLTPFFQQFQVAAKENRPFDIFLSDSGSGHEAKRQIQNCIDELLEHNLHLRERITYHREPTTSEPLSRAEAMNLGVLKSSGQILLFLHIDCRLPESALTDIVLAIANGAHGGGFTKTYSDKKSFSPLFCTEFYLNKVRTLYGRHLVGTNAIFMSRRLILEHPYVGDFLEDVEMSDWLRRRLRPGALKIIPKEVTVSAKKYHKYGPMPSIAINASVMILYRLLRVRPALLRAQLYHRRFPEGLKFWLTWLQAVLALIDKGGRRSE